MTNMKGIFETISLQEMDQVKLMNRTDTKFWFHQSKLKSILEQVKNDYFVLCMLGETVFPYRTIYFDTQDNAMYQAHHNGKLNRYKVRRRTYVLSNMNFLEVKFKNNKGLTIKKRIPAELPGYEFSENERQFLSGLLPFDPAELHATLMNSFSRITLVNKNFYERCTIDVDLNFETEQLRRPLQNMVIIEVKQQGRTIASPIISALVGSGIISSGFSKYAIGRVLTDSQVKYNAMKPRLRQIQKTLHVRKYS